MLRADAEDLPSTDDEEEALPVHDGETSDSMPRDNCAVNAWTCREKSGQPARLSTSTLGVIDQIQPQVERFFLRFHIIAR